MNEPSRTASQARHLASSATVLPIDHSLNVELANELARRESYNKHLYRPNTYLHKWWARRCGTTFRLLLKQLVEDSARRDYYEPGGLEGKVIADPMIGGGTTLHEAIRMGANVYGMDIDPIPILQARASLSDVSLKHLELAFAGFWHELSTSVEQYFLTVCPNCDRITQLKFMLYGLQRSCDCGNVIVVDSLLLRQEAGASSISICPRCHGVGPSDAKCNCLPTEGRPIIREKQVRYCPVCSSEFADETQLPFYARYVPLVSVGNCAEHGLFFKSVTEADRILIKKADERREVLDFGSLQIPQTGPKSRDLVRRGIAGYDDLFSSRQLLYLDRAIELIQTQDHGVALQLALLVSTSLEFNSMLCGYKGARKPRPGAIRHTFSHHAYSPPYTALENNPMYPRPSSGTLRRLFGDRVRRARIWALRPLERDGSGLKSIDGEVDVGLEVSQPSNLGTGSRKFYLRQGSATSLNLADASVDFIVTDPPYYDNVQYTDLAGFFRVWLQRLLPASAQQGIQWEYDSLEQASEPESRGGSRSSDRHYLRMMSLILTECHRVLNRSHGRLIFTFHHWNPSSWSALTLALKQASFVLLKYYVVHSENRSSVHIANLKSLTDDAILVLAPVEAGIAEPWQMPAEIDTESSAGFCDGCASLLGWTLAADLTDDEIDELWHRLLKY